MEQKGWSSPIDYLEVISIFFWDHKHIQDDECSPHDLCSSMCLFPASRLMLFNSVTISHVRLSIKCNEIDFKKYFSLVSAAEFKGFSPCMWPMTPMLEEIVDRAFFGTALG